MDKKLKQIPSKFDGAMWQIYYDATQEPLLILQSELCVEYAKLKAEYTKEPAKKYLHHRLEQLGKIIMAIDDSYKNGHEYIGSMADSFNIEYKRLEASNRREVEDMHQAYEFISERAIKQCERNISSPFKTVA